MATAETGRGALRTCGVAAVDEGAAFDRADKVLGAVVVNGVNQVVVEGAALYHADGHFAVPCRHSAAHALHLSGWSRGRGRRRRGVCVGCAAAAGGLAFALPPRGPAEAQHGSHGGEPQQTDHGAWRGFASLGGGRGAGLGHLPVHRSCDLAIHGFPRATIPYLYYTSTAHFVSCHPDSVLQ